MVTINVKHLRFKINKETYKDLLECSIVSLNTFDDTLVIDFCFDDELKSMLKKNRCK